MNPIGPNDLGHVPLQMPHEWEGDPSLRMKRVLDRDMLRMDICKRVEGQISEYRRAFGAEPLWVRISFDLVNRCGGPLFIDGDVVCGLAFRMLLEQNDTIEVGASSTDAKIFR